jgi:hypothetical protein
MNTFTDFSPQWPAGSWPDEEQTSLLRACLCDGDDALAGYRRWLELMELERVDYGSQRLVGLLYWNLREQAATDSWMGRWKGNYRYFWYLGQRQRPVIREVLGALAGLGFRPMILKGAALQACYYKNPALRPMEDLDVMVPRERMEDALRLLMDAGFATAGGLPPRPVLAVRHSVELRRQPDHVIDLHQRPFLQEGTARNLARLWERARPVEVEGVKCFTLCDEHQILHACVHGVPHNALPPMRWLADVAMILRHSQVDWDFLADEARRWEATLAVGQTLGFLREIMSVAIPDRAFESLARNRVSGRERAIHRLLVKPKDQEEILRLFTLLYWPSRHWLPTPGNLRGFRTYLHSFNVRPISQFVRDALRNRLRR